MRSVMEVMAAAAGRGLFARQHCPACGRMQYPPMPFCGACLGEGLQWIERPSWPGEIVAVTVLRHSHLPQWTSHLPCPVGLVRLSGDAMAICFLHASHTAQARVEVAARLDETGRAVLVAQPAEP